MGFIISPFLSPFAFGFLAARAKCVLFPASVPLSLTMRYVHSWRWTYGIGSMYGGFVVFMITFFLEET